MSHFYYIEYNRIVAISKNEDAARVDGCSHEMQHEITLIEMKTGPALARTYSSYTHNHQNITASVDG